jgi:hypothetical protein
MLMVRPFLSVAAVVLLLGLTGPVRADDEAGAILDKAIKAHGGMEKLTKIKAGRAKNKGKIELLGGLDFSQEVVYLIPDRFKETIELDVMGQQFKVVSVSNKGEAFITRNGEKVDLDDKLKAELKEGGHAMKVARLVPLKDKAFTLSALGEMQVEGKPAVGIKVSAKGFRDINLYFDKKTGLIAKVERRVLDAMSGEEVNEERIVQEYQKVDGLPVAKKLLINRDGKKFMEVEVVEYKYLDTVDENEFKP